MSLFKSNYLQLLECSKFIDENLWNPKKQLKTDNFTIVLTVRAHMTIEQPSKARGGFSLWKTPSALKPQHNTTSANAF